MTNKEKLVLQGFQSAGKFITVSIPQLIVKLNKKAKNNNILRFLIKTNKLQHFAA